MKCQICNEEFEQLTGIIFIPTGEKDWRGMSLCKRVYTCYECWLSYLAQGGITDNKEIQEWINFTGSRVYRR